EVYFQNTEAALTYITDKVDRSKLLLAITPLSIERGGDGLHAMALNDALSLASVITARLTGDVGPGAQVPLVAQNLAESEASSGMHWDDGARAVTFSYPGRGPCRPPNNDAHSPRTSMRVIGGTARGRAIKGPPKPRTWGTSTKQRRELRPTSDLIRGAIFDMLDAMGASYDRVLDLYAGTGALGIEALSRGDGTADFVENNPAAVAVIRANL